METLLKMAGGELLSFEASTEGESFNARTVLSSFPAEAETVLSKNNSRNRMFLQL